MRGIEFYFHLRRVLKNGDKVGTNPNYKFIKWTEKGGLQFTINNRQNKAIPADVIVAAYFSMNEWSKVIDAYWLTTVGDYQWCYEDVLKYLIKRYRTKK